MKRVFTAASLAEAHMVAHELGAHGIGAEVQGEADPLVRPTVWVLDDQDEGRALDVVAGFGPADASEGQPAPVESARRPRHWMSPWAGALLALSVAANAVLLLRSPRYPAITSDANHDGKPDAWWHYRGNTLVEEARDTNFDGAADAWSFYDEDGNVIRRVFDLNFDGKPDSWEQIEGGLTVRRDLDLNFDGTVDCRERYERGLIARRELDQDFDGGMDAWERHERGQLVSAEFDDDGDGRVDGWATYRHSYLTERYWSFGNDGVADKKATYEAGRKVREEHDRDRDGRFDEVVELDRFERPVRR